VRRPPATVALAWNATVAAAWLRRWAGGLLAAGDPTPRAGQGRRRDVTGAEAQGDTLDMLYKELIIGRARLGRDPRGMKAATNAERVQQ
jgi:hypothetical protein